MNRILEVCLLMSIVVVLATAIGHSQGIIDQIGYQGVLTDGGGVVVPNGNYDITFRFYFTLTGGSPLWEETQNLPVLGGIFNAILGTVTSLPKMNAQLYVAVAIEGGAELSPRHQLTPAPYALHSKTIAINSVGSSNLINGAVMMEKINTSFASRGEAITFDGTSVGWGTPDTPGLTLPDTLLTSLPSGFALSITNDSGARTVEVHNTGAGTALVVHSFTAVAAYIKRLATSGPEPAMWVSNNSQDGSAIAIKGSMLPLTVGGSSAGVMGETNGTGNAGYGVFGRHDGAGVAVYGETLDGRGVYGYATAGGYEAHGVYGKTDGPSGAGVVAHGSGSTGTALRIRDGGIQVQNAGKNTPTPVFIHETTAGNSVANITTIDHPLTNGDSNAIVIVTRNWNPGNVAGTVAYLTLSYSVFYTSGKWAIFLEESTAAMPVGIFFNVLVIKP